MPFVLASGVNITATHRLPSHLNFAAISTVDLHMIMKDH